MLLLVVLAAVCMPSIARWVRYYHGTSNVIIYTSGGSARKGYSFLAMCDESSNKPRIIAIEKTSKKRQSPSFCRCNQGPGKGWNMYIKRNWIEPGPNVTVYYSEQGEPVSKLTVELDECSQFSDGIWLEEGFSLDKLWAFIKTKHGNHESH